jgi:hypothetical protein
MSIPQYGNVWADRVASGTEHSSVVIQEETLHEHLKLSTGWHIQHMSVPLLSELKSYRSSFIMSDWCVKHSTPHVSFNWRISSMTLGQGKHAVASHAAVQLFFSKFEDDRRYIKHLFDGSDTLISP